MCVGKWSGRVLSGSSMVHYRSDRGPLPSFRPPTKHLVEVGRAWLRNVAGRGDLGTQIGGENVPLGAAQALPSD